MAVTADRLLTSAGIVTLGLGVAAWRARPPGAARPGGFLIVNSVLVSAGLVLLTVGAIRAWRRRSRPPVAPVESRPPRGPPNPGGYPLLGVALGTGLTALGPHVAIVFLGAIIAAWSAWLLARRGARLPAPAAPILTLLLIPTYWLLQTIAGPMTLAVGGLAELPLSPAAERVVASALLIVAWALSGLPPFHRQIAGALSAPAAALLLYRIGADALPDGIAYWRTIAFPVLVIGLWLSAFAQRSTLVAVAGGLLGLLSLEASGIRGGCLLLALAVGVEVLSRSDDGARWRIALVMLAVWGGIEALTGTLRVEVVYGVLAAIGAGVALATAGSNGPGYIWRDKR